MSDGVHDNVKLNARVPPSKKEEWKESLDGGETTSSLVKRAVDKEVGNEYVSTAALEGPGGHQEIALSRGSLNGLKHYRCCICEFTERDFHHRFLKSMVLHSSGALLGKMSERIRICHVDDEPDLADVTATYLEREDERFEVETARSASDGLERLDSREFDCIVSDYDMPGRNGIEFLRAIRNEYPELPVILYTGKGSEEVASEAISAGVTEYLQKETGTSQYTVLAHRISNAVEQYRARKTVEKTRQKLSQIADKSDDVLYMFDGDWSELLFLNSTFDDLWGVSRERVEENPEAFLEAIHPEDRDKARQSMEQLSDGRSDEIEYRLTDSDGDQRWVRGQSKPVVDDDGDVARIVGFVRDVTERKKRNRRFEAIFNNTYTFVGLLEPDGTVIEANETALSFGGLKRADVVGKPLWETYWAQSSEETRTTVRCGVEQASDGELFREKIEIQGADQTAVIDFSIRPITNEQDEVTLLVPEGRVMTEPKQEESNTGK